MQTLRRTRELNAHIGASRHRAVAPEETPRPESAPAFAERHAQALAARRNRNVRRAAATLGVWLLVVAAGGIFAVGLLTVARALTLWMG